MEPSTRHLIPLVISLIFTYHPSWASAQTPGGLDESFEIGSFVNDTVRATAPAGDGKVYIAGAFSTVRGAMRNRIARLNSDGTVDESFNPGTGATNGSVHSVAVQPDGKVLIGGSFSSYNGTARGRIARLNTDGSLDTAFDPGVGASSTVVSMVLQTDGKVLIGGSFSSYNGTARNRIARLNADGSLDTTFDPGVGAISGVGWESASIHSVAAQADGKVLIGGNFGAYNHMPRLRIVRLNANGNLDTTFDPSAGASSSVHSVAAQSDGKVLIGGLFTRYNDVPRSRIARLNTDGSLDTTFDPSAGAINNTVYSVAMQADGKVLIGGHFTRYNGTGSNRIARLNANGSRDTTFNPGTGASGDVHSVALQSDGKVFIGGAFTSYNGTGRNRIARLNTDGSLDTTFNPGAGASGSINSVVVQADGKVFIGGHFTSYNGTGRNRIARLNTDGSLDATFDPGTGTIGSVHSVAVQSDGKVFIGGIFASYNGTARRSITRLNADGSLDATFDPGTGAASNIVHSVAVQSDGKVLIGGGFAYYNGTLRSRIARLHADGSLDAIFDPGTGASENSYVYSVTLQADGKVFIGGNFSSYNGTARGYLARIMNGPASQTLTVASTARVEWLRGGSAPEVEQVTFESSLDGVVWTPLGGGDRISGGWELTGLSLRSSGHIRARGRALGGYYSGSSSIIEQVVAYSFPVPKIVLNGNGADIANGDAAPGTADHTDFGGTEIVSGSVTRTFTIHNSGSLDLQLTGAPLVQISGDHAADFTVSVVPSSTVEPSGSTTFSITFDPSAAGTRSATVSLPSNDADENPFTFAIQGEGLKSSQAIDFAPITDQLNTDTVMLSATGGDSGSVVTFVVTEGGAIASISTGNVLSFIGVGSVTITVSQAGNAFYEAAEPMSQTFSVSLDPQTETVMVILSNLRQAPDGGPKPVTVTTIPAGLPVVVTYNGSSTAPSALGNYTVVATVDHPLHTDASTSGTLVIDHRGDREVAVPEAEAGPPTLADVTVWNADLLGIYDGLLHDGTGKVVGALESLKLSGLKGGAEGAVLSGTLRLKGQLVKLKGAFSAGGVFENEFKAGKAKTPVAVSLKLQCAAPDGHEVVGGTVNWNSGELVASVYAPQAAYSKTVNVAANQQGQYTVLLPSQPGWGTDEPGGDGWGVLSIDKAGVVKLSGKLGDGTAVTETGYLSGLGEVCFYRDLHKSTPEKGRIGGRVLLRATPQSDLDGQLDWRKFADSKEKQYQGGFEVAVTMIGSQFKAAQTNERLLDELEDEEPNAVASLIAPGLQDYAGQEVERVLSWQANNKLVHYGPQKFSGAANSKTGLVSGSFVDRVGKLTLKFAGVVFQKQGLAAGQFVHGEGSGALRIMPGTGFAYPGSEYVGAVVEVEEAAPYGGLTLEDSAMEPAAAGTYAGLIGSDGALENLAVTSDGSFSGTLWWKGGKLAIRGTFDDDTPATVTLNEGGLTITLRLQKEAEPLTGYQVTGEVTDAESMNHSLTLQHRPVDAGGARADQAGHYTVVLPAPAGIDPADEPGGDGYGVLVVSAKGLCSGSVVLSDHAKTTFAGHVTQAGQWSFYRPLYGKQPKGHLSGSLRFRNETGISDVDGEVTWAKQRGTVTVPSVYGGGFTQQREAVGSRYTNLGKTTRAWVELDAGWHNVWVRLSGPSLSAVESLTGLDRVVSWMAANNAIHYYGPDKLSVKLNTATGVITGSYQNAPGATAIKQAFGGVLLQKQGLVSGSYVNAQGAGRFWMQAQ